MHVQSSLPALLACLFIGALPSLAQPRVDARNMYERVLAVLPLGGRGTFEDPIRPMYAPSPAELRAATTTRAGILGFTYVLSDDGKSALVEFMAKDRSAFQNILADKNIKSFLKGKDKREDVELEFKKHKKDFDFDKFGVRMP